MKIQYQLYFGSFQNGLNLRCGCLWNWAHRVCPVGLAFNRRYLPANSGKKVLHIDRNNFYGGEGASVNLTNMWKLFREKEEPNKELGHNRDWNIDLIPKYIMYGGKLVKILLKTKVSRYLEWKRIVLIIKQLTELMSFSSKKEDFSRREE